MKVDVVQIGANVGNTDNDPVYPRVKDGTLKTGLLIEANPKCIPILTKTYQEYEGLKIKNVAVSDTKGVLKFFIDNYDVGDGTSQHASVSLDFQKAHYHGQGSDIIHEVEIECATLESILEEYGITEIDWLYVDAEGHDYQILISTDFSKINVKNIYFENAHMDGPHNKAENYRRLLDKLGTYGYGTIKDENGNTTLEK